MATNLMNVFKNVDLQGVGKPLQILFLLRLSQTKKQGLKLHELY